MSRWSSKRSPRSAKSRGERLQHHHQGRAAIERALPDPHGSVAPADLARLLEDGDRVAPMGKPRRRRQSAQSRADDGDLCHLRVTTSPLPAATPGRDVRFGPVEPRKVGGLAHLARWYVPWLIRCQPMSPRGRPIVSPLSRTYSKMSVGSLALRSSTHPRFRASSHASPSASTETPKRSSHIRCPKTMWVNVSFRRARGSVTTRSSESGKATASQSHPATGSQHPVGPKIVPESIDQPVAHGPLWRGRNAADLRAAPLDSA